MNDLVLSEAEKFLLNDLKKFRDNPLLVNEKRKKAQKIFDHLKLQRSNIVQENRKWVSLKINNFFTSYEQKVAPSLKKIPFVIIEDSIIKDYSSACSQVKPGMSLKEAEELNKDLKKILFDQTKYLNETKKITKFLTTYDKFLERKNYDEFYLDITEFCEANFAQSDEEVYDVLKELKEKLKEEMEYSCTIGSANNKQLSKLALDLIYKKIATFNNNIFYLTNSEEKIELFLSKYPVEGAVEFLFEKGVRNLSLLGVKKLGDIPDYLAEIQNFFESQSLLIYSLSLGLGSHLHENVKISKPLAKGGKIEKDKQLIEAFDEFAKELYNEMEKGKLTAKTLTVEIIDNDFKKNTKSLSLIKRYQTEEEIKTNGRNLIKSIINGSKITGVKELKLKLTGIISNKKEETSKIDNWLKEKKRASESKSRTKTNSKSKTKLGLLSKSKMSQSKGKMTQSVGKDTVNKAPVEDKEAEPKKLPSKPVKTKGRPKTKQKLASASYKTLDGFIKISSEN